MIDIPTSFAAPGSLYDTFNPLALKGDPLPQTPTYKFSVTGTYEFPLPSEAGRLSVSATYTYRTSDCSASKPPASAGFVTATSTQADQNAIGILSSLGLLNANLNWRSIVGSPIDASIFVTNVTNKKYFNSVFDSRASGGIISQLVGEPRMYGLRLRYTFGS